MLICLNTQQIRHILIILFNKAISSFKLGWYIELLTMYDPDNYYKKVRCKSGEHIISWTGLHWYVIRKWISIMNIIQRSYIFRAAVTWFPVNRIIDAIFQVNIFKVTDFKWFSLH